VTNDAVFIMRLPKELKERFETAAYVDGMSLAKWLRQAGLDKLHRPRYTKPAPPARGAPGPDDGEGLPPPLASPAPLPPSPVIPPTDDIDALIEELERD
jgi:hypothetical protein